MSFSLATPAASLVGLAGAGALFVLLARERRSRRLCRLLGLAPSRWRTTIAAATPPVLLAALLGLAAGQPVVSRERAVEARSDAEVLFVLDVSRSMSARETPEAPTRLERARKAASRLRAELPGVPAGIVSLTDRVLPHLFPTPRPDSFDAALGRAIAVGRPPPARPDRLGRATALSALGALATSNFFGRAARRRVAVVLTDGETLPLRAYLLRGTLRRERVRIVFVHVWSAHDRLFAARGADPGYVPDPAADRTLDELAAAIGGRAVGEDDLPGAAATIRAWLGDGPTARALLEARSLALAPYLVAAAFVPLLLLLRSRNLWGLSPLRA